MPLLTLITDKEDHPYQTIEVAENVYTQLPRPVIAGRTFLGWNRYNKLNWGYMNALTSVDRTLYAITTDGAAYVVESYFRSVPGDNRGNRTQFRRYVLDIYLENATASSGTFKLENVNYILYYLGNIPTAGVSVTVTPETNSRGGAYREAAFYSTAGITVSWESDCPVDATTGRQKLMTLMLTFSKWDTPYAEIERRTSDEIVVPAINFAATADDRPATVSANFFTGVIPEDLTLPHTVRSVCPPEPLPAVDPNEVVARFAVTADAHIGSRYNWKSYDWLFGVYDHLAELHKEQPFDFVLDLGDNIDDGYDESYEPDYTLYLELVKHLSLCDPEHPVEGRAPGKIPHYEMQGNHDPSMKTRFPRYGLWFTENKKGETVAYICFFAYYGGYPAVNYNVAGRYESYCSYGIIKDETMAFIEESIQKAHERGASQIVLCSHFAISQDVSAPILPETGLGKIENLCHQHGIKLFLSGHEHNPQYSLSEQNGIYAYSASLLKDRYAVVTLTHHHIYVTIYNTSDHSVFRTDIIEQ